MRTGRGPQPVELLFGAYRRQVLSLLLLRPDESFYVREIGRLTGVPAGPLHRELKALAEVGLLFRKASGNQVRYQASRDCPIYQELDVLREALSAIADGVAVAFVFGSVAEGKEKLTSDIDLLVIGSASFGDVVERSHVARERLGREVNPVVMSKHAFRTKQRGRDGFISRVLKKPRIFIIGDASKLAELAEGGGLQSS
jgi:predicted nucleotidyltransferase